MTSGFAAYLAFGFGRGQGEASVVFSASGILGHKCGKLSESEATDKRFYFCSCREVRKCLLSFGAESFVFQVAIQKFKDKDI